jgi:hypothetical protein
VDGAAASMVDCCPSCSNPVATVSAQIAEARPAKPVRAPAKLRTPRKAPEPKDVLSLAKARLAAVEVKLEAMRKLQGEASTLRRMISAAESANNTIRQINGYANGAAWEAEA